MAKMALNGGFCFKRLKSGVEASIMDLSNRAKTAKGDGKRLERIREELGALGRKLADGATYDELFLASMRLGAIERELSLLDFFGQRKD